MQVETGPLHPISGPAVGDILVVVVDLGDVDHRGVRPEETPMSQGRNPEISHVLRI